MVLGAAWVCGSMTLRLLIHIPKDQEGERADSMQGWSINLQDHSNAFQSPSPKPVLADTRMHIFLAIFRGSTGVRLYVAST